jgi:hypothetical protein
VARDLLHLPAICVPPHGRKNKLTEWGLSNANLEPWGEFGKGWEQTKCYVAMTAPYYMPLIAMPRAWTGSTPEKRE